MSFHWNSDDENGEEDFSQWMKMAAGGGGGENNNNSELMEGEETARSATAAAAVVTPPLFASMPPSRNKKKEYDSNHYELDNDDDNNNISDNDDDDDDDDDSMIDWEDAAMDDDDDDDDDDDQQGEVDSKPAAKETKIMPAALRPVCIDLGSSRGKDTKDDQQKKATIASERKRRRRRKNKFRIESLPEFLQDVLWNLHRAHLLALTSYAVGASRQCSELEHVAIAHSLIPSQFHTTPTTTTTNNGHSGSLPSMVQLRAFLNWYFDWVHNVWERRQRQQRANAAAGAPTRRPRPRCRRNNDRHKDPTVDASATTTKNVDDFLSWTEYLSSVHEEDPQLLQETTDGGGMMTVVVQPQLYVDLLISMARSLGWRTRFVTALDPIISPDLDESHPWMASNRNVFESVAVSSRKKKTKKRKRTIEADLCATSDTTTRTISQQPLVGWVEILVLECNHDPPKKSSSSSNNNNNRKHRWVHVDPIRRLIDEPKQVETLLPSLGDDEDDVDEARKRRRSRPSTKRQQRRRGVLAYALGVEHRRAFIPEQGEEEGEEEVLAYRLTDVTPRYAKSYVASLSKRGVVRTKRCLLDEHSKVRNSWWNQTLELLNHQDSSHGTQKSARRPLPSSSSSGKSPQEAILLDDDGSEDDDKKPAARVAPLDDTIAESESHELKQSASNEAIPTSKAAFQTHPLYVIPSVMGNAEVLAPDANKHICGVFRGQLVYRRSDVSTALAATKWLYQGRKVREKELEKPVKRVKARKKPQHAGFKALQSYGVGESNDGSDDRRQQEIETGSAPLEDGMESLYGKWQTDAWSPLPVGPGDPIPVNEYKNVELALLNPGLVHVDIKGLASVAKKLGIPYAPCLLGFEGHGGNRTPTIRGIVVHAHNEQLIREAGVELTSHRVEQEHADRRRSILLKWKRLMVGLLTKDRLDREYGADDDDS